MKKSFFSRCFKKPSVAWLNVTLSLCLFAGIVKPIASDLMMISRSNQTTAPITSVAGFSFDMAGFLSLLGDMIKEFSSALNPLVESTVAGLEKSSAVSKELSQAGINYKAAEKTSAAGQGAVDLISNDTPSSCELLRENLEGADAKNNEGLLARALTASNNRQGLYTTSSGAAANELMKDSFDSYCSPENFERGTCKNGVSPKSMPDADINAVTLMSSSDGMSEKMSQDEFDAANKFVTWIAAPIQTESLPIALEKTPAGQRFILEQRRQQAIASSSQYALNRIIAARWEKK